MSQLDNLTQDEYRARYEQLRSAASKRPTPSTDPILPLARLSSETIPPGWYQSFRIKRGQLLRLINPEGIASVACQIWNADDTSERLNVGDTVKLQWSTELTTGRLLFSDMGRVLFSIIGDTANARHDALTGFSNAHTNQEKYGSDLLRNTRDNFCLAAAKLGLARRDIHPGVNFFTAIHTDETGKLIYGKSGTHGEQIDLRAEMNLIVTLSNCPHPLDPNPVWHTGPIVAEIHTLPPAAPNDLCRTITAEAQRGFDNTDALFPGA